MALNGRVRERPFGVDFVYVLSPLYNGYSITSRGIRNNVREYDGRGYVGQWPGV
jgi:hypothetical protein